MVAASAGEPVTFILGSGSPVAVGSAANDIETIVRFGSTVAASSLWSFHVCLRLVKPRRYSLCSW